MRPALVLWLAVVVVAGGLARLSALDEVLESPAEDVQAPEAPEAEANPAERLTTHPGIRFSGGFDSYAGLLLGWLDRPNWANLGEGFSISPVVNLASTLSFDARPVSYFRVWGTLSVCYPGTPGPADYSQLPVPSIAELFCDYSLYDVLFFRIGKQVINWGVARFFAIDNLPARVPTAVHQIPDETFDNSAGIGLKVNIPFGVHSLTTILQIKPSYLRTVSEPQPGEVGYGLSGELIFGNLELSVGGYYQQYLRPRALLAAKTSFFGIDLQAETILAYAEGPGVLASWVGSLFWEQRDVKFRIAAEYIYNAESGQPYLSDGEPGYPPGPAVACLAGFREIFGAKIDVGVQWEHAFLDGSGMVVPAAVYKPFGRVFLAIGFPVFYGPSSGEVMNLNPDPEKRRTALGLRISFSSSF